MVVIGPRQNLVLRGVSLVDGHCAVVLSLTHLVITTIPAHMMPGLCVIITAFCTGSVFPNRREGEEEERRESMRDRRERGRDRRGERKEETGERVCVRERQRQRE